MTGSQRAWLAATLLTALAAAAGTAGAAAAAAGASSAPPPADGKLASLDLDAIWCRYGLAGCGEAAAVWDAENSGLPDSDVLLPPLELASGGIAPGIAELTGSAGRAAASGSRQGNGEQYNGWTGGSSVQGEVAQPAGSRLGKKLAPRPRLRPPQGVAGLGAGSGAGMYGFGGAASAVPGAAMAVPGEAEPANPAPGAASGPRRIAGRALRAAAGARPAVGSAAVHTSASARSGAPLVVAPAMQGSTGQAAHGRAQARSARLLVELTSPASAGQGASTGGSDGSISGGSGAGLNAAASGTTSLAAQQPGSSRTSLWEAGQAASAVVVQASRAVGDGAWHAIQAARGAPGWALLFLLVKWAAALVALQLWRRKRRRNMTADTQQHVAVSVPAAGVAALLPAARQAGEGTAVASPLVAACSGVGSLAACDTAGVVAHHKDAAAALDTSAAAAIAPQPHHTQATAALPVESGLLDESRMPSPATETEPHVAAPSAETAAPLKPAAAAAAAAAPAASAAPRAGQPAGAPAGPWAAAAAGRKWSPRTEALQPAAPLARKVSAAAAASTPAGPALSATGALRPGGGAAAVPPPPMPARTAPPPPPSMPPTAVQALHAAAAAVDAGSPAEVPLRKHYAREASRVRRLARAAAIRAAVASKQARDEGRDPRSSSGTPAESPAGTAPGAAPTSAGSSASGSPRSPHSAGGAPTDMSVDPSVQARDLSHRGWAQTAYRRAGSTKPSFVNPLFMDPGDELTSSPGGIGGSGSEQASPSGAGASNALGSVGSSEHAWQSKQAVAAAAAQAPLARDHSLGLNGEDSFRLLAAEELPMPASPEDQLGAAGGRSSRAGNGEAVPRVASTPASKDGASAAGVPRKLTAARSVGPQGLPLPEEVEEAPAASDAESYNNLAAQQPFGSTEARAGEVEGSPSGTIASSRLAAGPSGGSTGARRTGSSLQSELSGGSSGTLYEVPAGPGPLQRHGSHVPMVGSASRPVTPLTRGLRAAQRGLCLLTSQQFQEEVDIGRVGVNATLLGVGAAACVYQGRFEGQKVAVKLMHPTNADVKAFTREVEAMAAAGRHPFIIGVLAACLEPPTLALVQELAATSLHDQLHNHRRRPLYATFLQLAEDVATALEHCHRQRPPLVHRDLSARNVLLGLDGRARVADFGLAAAKRRTFLSADKAGALGTAAYMAPEAMQAGNIDERCDVFSYGVLLWEMLTGHQAWEECSSPMQIIFAVGVERRRLPIPSGCPPPLASLLKQCWRHNGGLRPSFSEVLQRLRAMRNQDAFRQLKAPLAGHADVDGSVDSGVGGSLASKAAVQGGLGGLGSGADKGRAKSFAFAPAAQAGRLPG